MRNQRSERSPKPFGRVAAMLRPNNRRRVLPQGWSALDQDARTGLLRELGIQPRGPGRVDAINVRAYDLLSAMLRALGIAPWRIKPVERDDLERQCLFCPNARRCSAELASGLADGTFEHFCPNANALKALRPKP